MRLLGTLRYTQGIMIYLENKSTHVTEIHYEIHTELLT
jgi:hypothetical protein